MNSLKCEIEKCLLMKERDTITPTVKCDNCGHSVEVISLIKSYPIKKKITFSCNNIRERKINE